MKPPPILRLKSNERGTVGIIFAFSLTALALAAGMAIDYSRTLGVKTQAQSLLDSALLAGIAEARSSGGSSASLARQFFDRHWRAKFGARTANVNITTDADGRLLGHVSIKLPPSLLKAVRPAEIAIEIRSAVSEAEGAVEIAPALDVTASMAGTKLDGLKTAASDLTQELFSIPDASQRVKIGVVPFARYVNVGESNRNASWMSVANDSTSTDPYCYDKREITGQSNCRTETATMTVDGIETPYTYQTCDYEYSDPVSTCEDRTTTTTWYGCAGSRDYPLNIQDQSFSTPVPGVMNASCGSELTPLTDDETTVTNSIDALTASGDTYIPSGLTWAWRLLSPSEPFAQGVAYGAMREGIPVRKVLVLMTDGVNTRSPNYPDHNGSDRETSDDLTTELCNNIKMTGIDIYTVAFEVTDDDTKSLLKSCATDAKHYFDATNSEELRSAFVTIAKEITPLRLTK